MFALVILNKA